ncbi:hypothetical protein QAD02_011704 [Eretmocerus hayati]|uniref:Uncharacterized protein n=1 Tax=Eretmocerus hayati TaxID=131215 RepID=A0ACC2NYI2_9HYME|nr:hypothetical protein QAD02_011704 [Eretmocerus hayati]
MSALKCFDCGIFVDGGLDGLSQHFRYVHGSRLDYGVPGTGFICGQDGCVTQSTTFKNFRRHVRNFHTLRQHANEDDFDIDDPQNQAQLDLDIDGVEDIENDVPEQQSRSSP